MGPELQQIEHCSYLCGKLLTEKDAPLMGILENVMLVQHWKDQPERISLNWYFLEPCNDAPFLQCQMKQINVSFILVFSWKAGKPLGEMV